MSRGINERRHRISLDIGRLARTVLRRLQPAAVAVHEFIGIGRDMIQPGLTLRQRLAHLLAPAGWQRYGNRTTGIASHPLPSMQITTFPRFDFDGNEPDTSYSTPVSIDANSSGSFWPTQ